MGDNWRDVKSKFYVMTMERGHFSMREGTDG